MDNSRLEGGFVLGPSSGFLGLESSIHRNQYNQLSHPSNHQHHQHQMQSPMNLMTGLENDCCIGLMGPKVPTPNRFSMSFGKGKSDANDDGVNNNNSSEDDEPSFTEDGSGDHLNETKSKKGSLWQRMKWTDSVIRLLIQVVGCVGDDDTLESVEGFKRKAGVLQKKGKWKTVSKIMIGKGCHVSPQQCEDKFNDLNKRYKKLNDILGRGTCCRVVENPSLMNSMPQLSAKMKEDVKKILSSKHLFYKEMCAYHNGQRIPNCSDLDLQAHSLPLAQCSKDNNGSEEEEPAENSQSDNDGSDNEDEINAGGDDRMETYGERDKNNEDDFNFLPQIGGHDHMLAEMAEYFKDPSKAQWEQKEWIKKHMLQLEEQKISIQVEAFELEQQHFKWQRFCSKKDRELEISRLKNERLILENERMMLQLKQKELELGFKRTGTSFDPTCLSIDALQGRD